MSESIECIRCGAVSYNEYGKTPLTCNLCYEKLETENKLLKQMLSKVKSWVLPYDFLWDKPEEDIWDEL